MSAVLDTPSRSQRSPVVRATPADADLLASARDMVARLRERAARCESERQVPDETIAEFRAAGFFDILKVPQYGGLGLPMLTLCKVIQEIGRGCMPSAWVLFVLASHPYEVGLMAPEAADAFYRDNPEALIGSSFAPLGKMEKVEGGYRLSGTWRFSSGIDHADWVGVGGMVRIEGEERPDYRICFVHKSQYVIDQNSWRVIGQSGTGSKDLAVAETFVPEHLSHSLVHAHLMLGQETLPPAYRYPYWQVVNYPMASAIIGGALGAIDEFQRQFATRVNSFDTGKGRAQASDDPFVKSRLGQATMLVRGAQARVEMICREMARRIEAGEPMPVPDRLGWSAEAAQCGRMCEEAVLLLFKATGARGLSLDNPIQAILRNVMGATNHIAMNVEGVNTALGNLMLGRDNAHLAC